MPLLTPALDVQLKSILIATDFSEVSHAPLRHALAIARHYGAKLYLTHVISSYGYAIAGPESVVLASEAVYRDAQKLEDELAARGDLSGFPHEIVIREGDIWEELKEVVEQEHIDLIVVGMHARTGLGKLLLGSDAEQIFRHAPCPVLTVGPCSYPEPRVDNVMIGRPILFPTDFQAGSSNALPYAVGFARERHARLVVVHVLPPIPPTATGLHWCTAEDLEKLQETFRLAALEKMHEVIPADVHLPVDPEFVVEFGLPANGILRLARIRRPGVIVMGLHNKDHIISASHYPWATAYDVVCGAACPVLTTRKQTTPGHVRDARPRLPILQ